MAALVCIVFAIGLVLCILLHSQPYLFVWPFSEAESALVAFALQTQIFSVLAPMAIHAFLAQDRLFAESKIHI